MEVLHKEDKAKGQFYIENNDGNVIATLVYRLKNDSIMVIEHTEVDPSLRGQGIGVNLIDSSVKFAREQHYKIQPLCSYAAAIFNKTPEYSDVKAV